MKTSQGLKSLAMAVDRPRVLAVGDPETVDNVAKELLLVGIDTKKLKFIKDVAPAAHAEDLGVIYVAPLKRSQIFKAHSRLRKKTDLKNIPFFAVVPNWMSGRNERKMYKEGIRMIFEWPREKQEFSQLFYSSVFSGTKQVRSEDTDESLLNAVKNRVTGQYGSFCPKVHYSAFRGVVLLRGIVPSSEYQKDFVKIINETPGVKGVVQASLKVAPATGLDLTSMAEQTMTDLEDIPSTTLDFEISRDQKNITLIGTLPNRAMITKVREPLKRMAGITNVSSRIVVSKNMYKRDLDLAKKAQYIINNLLELNPSSLKVIVTTGIAILKGRANDESQINRILEKIQELEGIRQIDSQILH